MSRHWEAPKWSKYFHWIRPLHLRHWPQIITSQNWRSITRANCRNWLQVVHQLSLYSQFSLFNSSPQWEQHSPPGYYAEQVRLYSVWQLVIANAIGVESHVPNGKQWRLGHCALQSCRGSDWLEQTESYKETILVSSRSLLQLSHLYLWFLSQQQHAET